MKGLVVDIETATKENDKFRKVLYTGQHSQWVLMALVPREEIGLETHAENDQFFRFEQGEGEVVVDGRVHKVTNGSGVIVPAGARHNVKNTSDDGPLKFYTIYSPPHHKDGIVRATKAEAETNEAEFDGITSE